MYWCIMQCLENISCKWKEMELLHWANKNHQVAYKIFQRCSNLILWKEPVCLKLKLNPLSPVINDQWTKQTNINNCNAKLWSTNYADLTHCMEKKKKLTRQTKLTRLHVHPVNLSIFSEEPLQVTLPSVVLKVTTENWPHLTCWENVRIL